MVKFKYLGVGAAVLVLVSGVAFTASSASAEGPKPGADGELTLIYPVGTFEWIVPQGVDRIVVDMYGAQGSDGTPKDSGKTIPGGKGGRVKASLPVTVGEKLQINVGGQGHVQGGSNGGAAGASVWAGAGGGASDIRTGAFDPKDRVLVVGGGGGGGSYSGYPRVEGGAGGGGGAAGPDNEVGGEGSSPRSPGRECAGGHHYQGYGGGPTWGGQSGISGCISWPAPYSGSLGEGGNGLVGGGTGAGGGGGGGWFGGGGGSFTAGGGGGSGHAVESAHVEIAQRGVRPGDGQISITYWTSR